MKKRNAALLAAVLSMSMIFGQGMSAMAANTYNTAEEMFSGTIVYPGDTISGVSYVVFSEGETQSAPIKVENSYTVPNDGIAYTAVEAYTEEAIGDMPAGEYLRLEKTGYVLDVYDGEAKLFDVADENQPASYVDNAANPAEDVYTSNYPEGSMVEINVALNKDVEGVTKTFDSFEVECSDSTLTEGMKSQLLNIEKKDDNTVKVVFKMPKSGVIIKPKYAEAQTEAQTEPKAPAENENNDGDGTGTVEGGENQGDVITDLNPENVDQANVEQANGEQANGDQANGEQSNGEQANGEQANGEQANGEQSNEDQANGEQNAVTTYTVETVGAVFEDGTTSKEFAPGDEVTVYAMDTSRPNIWSASDNSVWFSEVAGTSNSFSMPSLSVTITAEVPQIMANVVTYSVNVEGKDPVTYAAGDTVTVTADDKEGYDFTGWEVTSGNVTLDSAASKEVSFTMPEGDVNLRATYAEKSYNVYINGSETPSYTGIAGSTANVSADVPEGSVFTGWTVADNAVTLADPSQTAISFAMPAGDVRLTANFQEQAKTYKVTLNGADYKTDVTEGTTVTAVPSVPDGMEFAGWSAEGITIADPSVASLEFAMPANDVNLTANFKEAVKATVKSVIDLSEHVTIVSGAEVTDGSNYGEEGHTITVTATPPYTGYIFTGFLIVNETTGDEMVFSVSDEDELTASFVMPDAGVYVEATYEKTTTYNASVENGTGDGNYPEGAEVEITADTPKAGYVFTGWTDALGNAGLVDAASETTSFIMPAENVQLKANYKKITYTLTVSSGFGGGSYSVGDTVNISAEYPAAGKEFAGWAVTTQNASIADASRYYAVVTMPAANATVEATYKDGPSAANNAISGIEAGGEYLKGASITFTAVGAGMENSNPNPGDYRYRPTGYQIGSVNGGWNNAKYTTSMAINATGEYTLTVTFAKDVFDGNNWVADGTTDTKQVSFYVVNALSVNTGDNSPILPLAAAGGAALLVILGVVILKIKRRR